MKKIVALLLALIMALTATIAFAEPAQSPSGGLVLTSTVAIDRAKVGQFMDEMELDEQTRGIVDSLLAVVNATTDRLTIAENGVEYRLSMKDAEVLSFTFGKTDEGMIVFSNLMPGHAVTVSNDILEVTSGVYDIVAEILKAVREAKRAQMRAEMEAELQEEEEALEVLIPYVTEFILNVIPAIHVQEEEKGDFTFEDGCVYNTRLKIDIDNQVVADAHNTMIADMSKDEAVIATLEMAGVTPEELFDSFVSVDEVPVIDITLYANLDDKGENTNPDKGITVSATLPKRDNLHVSFEMHQHEDGCQALLDIPGKDEASSISAAFDYAPFNKDLNGGHVALDVYYKGNYFGDMFTVQPDKSGDDLIAKNDLYILDAENPLATAQTVIQTGVPALDLSTGDRNVIPVENLLIGEESDKLSNKLTMEVMISCMGIIGTITETVPEFANLLTLLNSVEAA